MSAPDLMYVEKRTVSLPQGGSVTVTIRADESIDEKNFLILRSGRSDEAERLTR